jgi:hypothetical protein
MLREPSDKPNGATNIACLRPNCIAAAPNNIINRSGIYASAFDKSLDRMGTKVCRVDACQASLFAPNGGSYGIYNIGFWH